MEDGNPPSSFGNQQRNQHPRPFFYVQPPSQPYYLYQPWQLTSPYPAYSLPGGYNFGRPCVHPYPYMQYPGFVLPHAPPIHPMDYRRMFEPRFHSPPWHDAFQPPPAPPHREVACSEAQTDPSDALAKLIECLSKIRAGELGAERELDSGVASQGSGMFSPREEQKKCEEDQGGAQRLPHLESRAGAFSDAVAGPYGGGEPSGRGLESGRSLEDLRPRACWSVGFEEELPLDSSSVHEDRPDNQRLAGAEQPEDAPVGEPDLPTPDPDGEDVATQRSGAVATQRSGAVATQRSGAVATPSQLLAPRPGSQAHAPPPQGEDRQLDSLAEVDLSYQVLKLPLGGALSDAPLLCEDTPVHLASSRVSSPAPSYRYALLPAARERVSVLSPSLDELSSRDEMFSTDLEDVDLLPGRVYARGRPARASEGAVGAWLAGPAQRYTCACCGTSLAAAVALAGPGRGELPDATRLYEAGDSDEEGGYAGACEPPARVVVRKHCSPRKPLPLRHASKPSHRSGQRTEPASAPPGDYSSDGGAGEGGDDRPRGTSQDRLCHEDMSPPDAGRWQDADVKPRRKRRQDMSAGRKGPCRPACRRSRDQEMRDEEEEEEEEGDGGEDTVHPRGPGDAGVAMSSCPLTGSGRLQKSRAPKF